MNDAPGDGAHSWDRGFTAGNRENRCYAASMDALIHHLEQGHELSSREVEVAADLLLNPAVADAKKERLLEMLAAKGETPGEIAGFVEVFLEHAVDPHVGLVDLEGPTLDVCGTGGDHLGLINVSTTAMFIAAAAVCWKPLA